MDVPKELIPKFSDPEFWVKYFPQKSIEDLKLLGLCVDWRRSFITTSLNPFYDKFIKWQLNKLKEKNFVVKGNSNKTPNEISLSLKNQNESSKWSEAIKILC